ncbi:MAG: KEOPS complex kinase/ATPase Bud32 [Candidatus Woesearchaeota archaeon]
MRKVLGSGAEATIYLDDGKVDKERSKKNYRHEDIDSVLRKTRTRKESKILKSLEKYGFVPKILEQKEYNVLMEHIDGIQLKKLLDKDPKLAILIGKNLSVMHDLNIVHGDLTTSNMILSGKGRSQKLFFIDFGLSYNSTRIEDKAVDIHLFKQALESKHFRVNDKAYKYFLAGYNPKDKNEILERLAIVETRGRYKEKT